VHGTNHVRSAALLEKGEHPDDDEKRLKAFAQKDRRGPDKCRNGIVLRWRQRGVDLAEQRVETLGP